MYSLLICIATCTTHHVSAFGADGYGNAFFVEAGQRIDFNATLILLSGQGATFMVSDEIFHYGFEVK